MVLYVVQTETISCESPKVMFCENLQAFEKAILGFHVT